MSAAREAIKTELSPPPVASSVDRPWSGMTVQLHDWQTAGSVVSPSVDHDIIAMRVTGNVRLTQYRAGKVERRRATPGHVTIHARGFESRWSWDGPGAIVVVRASQHMLEQAADVSVRRTDNIELKNCFGASDAFVEPIMYLFAAELRRPPHPVQQLISGCLSAALAGHLVQRFEARSVTSATDPGELEPHALRRVLDYIHTQSQTTMTLETLAEIAGVSPVHFAHRFRRSTGLGLTEYVCRVASPREETASQRGAAGRLANWQIKRVTDHMLEHLDRHLGLDELAELVDLSRAHFCTAFRRTVGQTPREWLIEARMERARKLLADSRVSITEVALALGYSPSSFGAVFRERVGVTPSAYRRVL
ncbi:MAG TPA: helix-turn-helix domain-containing protein [Steroidobacter sp.]